MRPLSLPLVGAAFLSSIASAEEERRYSRAWSRSDRGIKLSLHPAQRNPSASPGAMSARRGSRFTRSFQVSAPLRKNRVRPILLAFFVAALAVQAATFPVEEASIASIQSAYLRGEVSAHEIVAAYLARIAAYDKDGPYINSIINLNPDALTEADAQDAYLKKTGKLIGPLHGITFLVKDNI